MLRVVRAHTPRSAIPTTAATRPCHLAAALCLRPARCTFGDASAAPATLREFGYRALSCTDASEKATLTLRAAEWWKTIGSNQNTLGNTAPPSSPARPPRPLLYGPREMPRSGGGHAATLLHNLAHIELNAVDIGWDLVLRFQDKDLPTELFSDWLSILADEASHFHLLDARLRALGSHYGALPAHNNLWRVAEQTASSLLARIAMVQLVQEARGLDSHERLVSKFYGAKDPISAKIIDKICKEEVRHVQLGVKWFTHLCEAQGKDPISTFHGLVEEHVDLKRLPPPFNTRAREAAGMSELWYMPIALQPRQG